MNITLSLLDFASISPLLILLASALLLLFIESFFEIAAKKISCSIAIITFGAAIVATIYAPESKSPLLAPWLRFDSIALSFNVLFLLIGIGCALLADAFFKRFDASHGEYYFLLVSSIFGLLLIGQAADLLTVFLGIETLSIALYILCGYMKEWKLSHEAALKYFLMGALATAFFLYGIALIYGATGTTQLGSLLSNYKGISDSSGRILFLAGTAFVTIGLAFKAALVPFHVWAPDVYEGAPTPVTAFMATGTKAGALAAFAVIFLLGLPHFDPLWNQAVSILVYASLIYANFVALKQTQLRRFFAYSGISHAGFLLIPVISATPDAPDSLLFYLAIYALATLGSFAVLALLDQRDEGIFIRDLNGLYRRSPWAAVVMAICILTLAGIPPTAGFFAKFYIFKVAFESGNYGLVIVGLLTTILAVYYYLRIIAVMFSEASVDAKEPRRLWPAACVGAIACGLVILLSIYPESVLKFITQ